MFLAATATLNREFDSGVYHECFTNMRADVYKKTREISRGFFGVRDWT